MLIKSVINLFGSHSLAIKKIMAKIEIMRYTQAGIDKKIIVNFGNDIPHAL